MRITYEKINMLIIVNLQNKDNKKASEEAF